MTRTNSQFMSIYLHDIPLAEARAVWWGALAEAGLDGVLGMEELPLDEQLLGRVLAEPVWAKISAPHYHASAMDGFAVRSADTTGALLNTPKLLRVGEQTSYVDTGDPLPDWADAVIQIEHTEPITAANHPAHDTPRQPYAILIREAIPPWRNVRPMGEDMVATQLVLPQGHVLRPVDLGALAGSGQTHVRVARRPRVAIIPTGTELKPIGQPVQAGDIIEYNSMVLAAQVGQWGGVATRWLIVPDNLAAIQAAVREAAESHDLILLNAGSSAGAEDFSAQVVASLGRVLVHGIAVRPGHPVIMGMVAGDKGQVTRDEGHSASPPVPRPQSPIPILGVPGYPVSAALTGEILVEPLLAMWQGRRQNELPTMQAELTRKTASPLGDDDYVRVVVGKVGERVLAAPIQRGAGVISSLVRADGLVVFPAGSQGQPAGAQVTVHLYRPAAEIERTILAIGSHDMALDVLGQYLAGHGRRLASANVGSLGGLVALRRGEAHLAGAHLLDAETGTYNTPFLAQYLPDVPVTLVTLVGREQGLIVPAGNPHGLRGLEDVAERGARYVNRQRGAGTRLLLDYHLAQLGIAPEQVQGYEQEEYTHLAVAAAVASGRAACGLGIPAAAQALDLGFVPLFQERYDLVVPTGYYAGELLQPLWEILQTAAFRHAIAALPGYDVSHMGEVVR